MLHTEHRSEPLEVLGQGSEEPAFSHYGCKDAGRLEGHNGFMPPTVLHKGDSSVSSASTDEMFMDVQEAGKVSFSPHAHLWKGDSGISCSTDFRFDLNAHEASHESVEPSTDLRKGGSGCSTSSTDERFNPSVSETGNIDTPTSPAAMDVDVPARAPVQLFPGYVETHFSTPHKRYFHKQTTPIRVGSGTFAVVTEVYWYNPSTGDLESRVAKSFRVERAATHSRGMLGWKADAFHERDALRYMAGVPGVVRCWDIIDEADGIHLIMENVGGISLSAMIGYRGMAGVGLTWLQIRLALKELAQVLAECHKRRLVHGDLKPENVMSLLGDNGITLIDFGCASIWNDCWAYGLTAFKVLTGSSLFKSAEDATPPDEGSGVDIDWEDWRAQCIIDLHADWADPMKSRPIHATFREKLQQLAGASEEFQLQGMDFLHRLLDPDPAHRLTAEEALQHPFLTSPFVSVPPDSMPLKVELEVKLDTSFKRRMWDMCDVMLTKHMG